MVAISRCILAIEYCISIDERTAIRSEHDETLLKTSLSITLLRETNLFEALFCFQVSVG